MAGRYQWLSQNRMAAIPIGGDPDDFATLALHPPPRTQQIPLRQVTFSYVGTFLPRAGPLMRELFRALRQLKEHRSELASRLMFHFVGTSNQSQPGQSYAVRSIAIEEGVDDLVTETPQRVPYLQALNIMASSSCLLLIGSDEPHYTASKIYPALMSGRPYLSLFHKMSSAHSILQSAGGGLAFGFADLHELHALAPQIYDGICRMVTAPESLGRASPLSYRSYTAEAIASEFARVFGAVSR